MFFSSLLAAAAMSAVPAWADYTWDGGNEITQKLWQTESSWTLSGGSKWVNEGTSIDDDGTTASGTGPGTSYSGMLDGTIVIAGAEGSQISGTIDSLEGWALKLDLKNTHLTVGDLKKFQGGTSITLDDTSVLTVNGFSVGKAEGAITLSGAGTIVGKMFFSQGGYHSASVNLDSWTGTIKSVDLDLSGKDALNLSHHGNAKSSVELSGFSGYFSEQNDGTVSTNIKLTNSSTSDRNYAVNITNGYADKTLTFTGKISGDGTFKNTANVAQGFLFTGDVSGFSGKFEQSGTGVLMFGNNSAGATTGGSSVSGTGEIAWGNNNVVYNYSNDVVASNTITSAQLIKKGSGSLTLTGTNTYAGGTTIEAGTLVAANASALGTGTVFVAGNAKLSLGTKAVSVGSLSGAGSIGLATGTTSSTLTVNQTTNTTFSGSIGDPYSGGELVSLVKQGSGTLELGGHLVLWKLDTATLSTSYGNVTVDAGTLKFSGDGNVVAGALSVKNGATLDLVGDSAARATLQSVEISEGATIVIDMSAFADKSETFDVELITTNKLKYKDTTITNDNVEAVLGGAITLSNWKKTGWKQSLSYVNSNGDAKTLKLTMTNVPEPSMFGVLAGVGALAFVAARRRRRAK